MGDVGVVRVNSVLAFVEMGRWSESIRSRVIDGMAAEALAALADMIDVAAVEADWAVSSLLSDPRKEENVVPLLGFRL